MTTIPATRLQRRAATLNLYRRCLRSATKCPRYEHAMQMKLYTKMRFRDSIKIGDPQRILFLLKEGEEELRVMNEFHKVYAVKREEQDAYLMGNEVPGKNTLQ